jgi:hypothetical protein
MISFYFQGLASEEELIAHIEKQAAAKEAKRAKEERKEIGSSAESVGGNVLGRG